MLQLPSAQGSKSSIPHSTKSLTLRVASAAPLERTIAALMLRVRDGGFELLTVDSAVQRAQQLVRKRIPAGRSLVDELIRERRREAQVGGKRD